MVFKTKAVDMLKEHRRAYLSIRSINGQYLATGEFLRRPAFILLNVSSMSSYHRIPRPGHTADSQCIGCSPGKNEIYFGIASEMFFEKILCLSCVAVITVSHNMAFVDRSKFLQNLRMYSRVIVAGKSPLVTY